MTSCTNTPAPLFEEGLCYSPIDNDILNKLRTTNLIQLDTILVQQLRRTFTMLMIYVTHLLANPRIMTSVVASNCDHLSHMQEEVITVRDIAQNLATNRNG
jgi:hypothetical protein